jgi:hydrogenase expression/formation protein HypD
MLRVPGSRVRTCSRSRAGGDVRVVYSPLDAVTLAREHPRRGRSSSSASASRRPRRPTPWPCYQANKRGCATSRCWSRTCWCRPPSPRSWSRRQPRAGVPGRRPRVQRDGHVGIRRWWRATTCRSWSPASSRSTCWRASAAPVLQLERGEARGRERLRPRRAAEPATSRTADAGRGLRGHRSWLARHRRDPAERLAAARSRTATSTPKCASTCRTSAPRSPAVPQRRGAAGLLKPNQCPAFGKECTPRTPSAPRWCRAKARARPTITTGASSTGSTSPPPD